MSMNPLFLLFAVGTAPHVLAQQAAPQPGERPAGQLDEALESPPRGRTPRVYGGGATGGFTVTPSSRELARQFYNAIHETSEGTAIAWTGSVAACNAGTTSDDFKKAVILRVNYFRAMAGVPANVALDQASSTGAQQAALMMSANNSLSHTPPPGWACYTAAGANAAGQSNLYLSLFGYNAVDGYVRDPGAGNGQVGHRRWVLYPQTENMGTGDVPPVGSDPAANALWIFDAHTNDPRPATREAYVAWPPPGYVPYQVAFPRWSFALAGADLTGMSVTMKQGAANVSVTMESYTPNVGENTRAWMPAGPDLSNSPAPAADIPYTVTVSGVKIGGVTQSPYIYTVAVFDPAKPGADTVVPSLSGPAALNTGQPGTYTHPLISFADSYDLVETAAVAFSEVEGAENGLANMTANLPAGYNAVSTTVKATGTRSFHLTNPGFQSQSLTLQRTLLPTAASRLQFKSRLAYAAAIQTAHAQVSKDGGLSWADVYFEAGTSSLPSTFTQRDVALAAYAGIPVQIRLLYHAGDGSLFTDTGDNFGWYIDDLTVTNASLLTNPVVVTNGTGTTFVYTPATAGQKALYVRPRAFQGYPIEGGAAVAVTVSPGTGPATMEVTAWSTGPAGGLRMDFTVTGASAGAVYTLQTSPDLAAAWTGVPGASLLDLGGGHYRFTAANPAAARSFYRVKLN